MADDAPPGAARATLHTKPARRNRLSRRSLVAAQLIHQNQQLEQEALRQAGAMMLPLEQAERELAAQLARYMGAPDPDERIDRRYLLAGLVAIAVAARRTADFAGVSDAMDRTLASARAAAAELSRRHFEDEMRRLSGIFDGPRAGAAGGATAPGLPPPMGPPPRTGPRTPIPPGSPPGPPGSPPRPPRRGRFDPLVIERYPRSRKRYGERTIEEIRGVLTRGHRKGETFEQMTRRTEGVITGRKPRVVVTERIPEVIVNRERRRAERIVRTESIEAYNQDHEKAIRDAAADDGEILKRWDASVDRRVCPTCRALDGQVVAVDAAFSNGLQRPPAHPNCRCAITPWKKHWPALEGMGPEDTGQPRQKLA